MPIPREILNVPRPKNTVVIAYGRDKRLYAVRQRVGCRNAGGRHLPVNGPTIGHIVDGACVPIAKSAPQGVSLSTIDLKDWASVVLCDRLFKSIQGGVIWIFLRRLPTKLMTSAGRSSSSCGITNPPANSMRPACGTITL